MGEIVNATIEVQKSQLFNGTYVRILADNLEQSRYTVEAVGEDRTVHWREQCQGDVSFYLPRIVVLQSLQIIISLGTFLVAGSLLNGEISKFQTSRGVQAPILFISVLEQGYFILVDEIAAYIITIEGEIVAQQDFAESVSSVERIEDSKFKILLSDSTHTAVVVFRGQDGLTLRLDKI